MLAGLLHGDVIDALVEAVAPLHVRGWFTPHVAVLEPGRVVMRTRCAAPQEVATASQRRGLYPPSACQVWPTPGTIAPGRSWKLGHGYGYSSVRAHDDSTPASLSLGKLDKRALVSPCRSVHVG